jgi:hypothetical protein
MAGWLSRLSLDRLGKSCPTELHQTLLVSESGGVAAMGKGDLLQGTLDLLVLKVRVDLC